MEGSCKEERLRERMEVSSREERRTVRKAILELDLGILYLLKSVNLLEVFISILQPGHTCPYIPISHQNMFFYIRSVVPYQLSCNPSWAR